MNGKIIVIDWQVFVHTAIFSWRNNKNIPMTYTTLNMIISCLRRIGIEPEDTVYIATDFLKSWRKQYAEEYKQNRKAFRESFEDINWQKMYNDADDLLDRLDKGTEFITIRAENCEADDIASYIVRHNLGKEIILVTVDSDWTQLWHFGDNIKIFSPKTKPKRYKIKPKNFNVYQLIASKIKEEKTDNLVSEIKTEDDYDTRMMLVNLLELPEFVDKKIEESIKIGHGLKACPPDLELVPFNGLREKIGNIYNDHDAIITYEWTKLYEEKIKKKKTRK